MLKWTEIKSLGTWVAHPYRIIRATRGFDLWFHGERSARLGQEIASRGLAEDMAEAHRMKSNAG